MVDKTLESEHNAPEPLKIQLRNGDNVTIHPHHVDFYEKLTKLPVPTRIQMMELTIPQLQNYISNEKRKLLAEVNVLLSKKWFWRETGERVDIDHYTIPEVRFSFNEMKSPKRTIDTLYLIKEFFTGNNREVYSNDGDV